MRRIALSIAIFGALAAPAQAAPAKVVLTECAPADRAAEFEARMGKVEDAVKLKMRFTLQVRKAGQKTYHRVAAPGFRSWTTAEPGAMSWVFSRRVESLLGPARYRAQVRFQWIDADGKTVARAKRSSRSCFQPDHRPNLKLKALTREGKHRYAALIVNNGRTAPGPFDAPARRRRLAARAGRGGRSRAGRQAARDAARPGLRARLVGHGHGRPARPGGRAVRGRQRAHDRVRVSQSISGGQ